MPGTEGLLPILNNRTANFDLALAEHGIPRLTRRQTTTLQINVGKLCNQACHHCHVEAGPKRTEVMPADVVDRLLELLELSPCIETVDVTGGAPELNPHFRRLVRETRRLNRRVIDRCNLTVLLEAGQEDLAEFLASNRVEVVASLPCYTAENVDRQRGRGVFDKSIRALKLLNDLGYDRHGSGLSLHLVYNPLGAFLPPPQEKLEAGYKMHLRERFGIEFNRLFTLTNMPIKRFADFLVRSGQVESYLCLLVNHFNPATVEKLMCRSLVSVGWNGRLYDCDFNQMLEIGTLHAGTLWDIRSFDDWSGERIAVAGHCFGCTAGAGSSCGGSLQ
ncbi:MAG: arsenosugar biosynthesis radical SAM protein ArsS [Acidobacteria bacterium]|nr:arsenosugar biosynthesis radical SAM protein ArsS [Acidobacteriota bacterium]